MSLIAWLQELQFSRRNYLWRFSGWLKLPHDYGDLDILAEHEEYATQNYFLQKPKGGHK
jgi:hypothetical protein